MAIPVVTILTAAAKLLGPSLQNLTWESWTNCQKVVSQIEAAREQAGEPKTWERGRSLLKSIKTYFDRQRTSWWPPDKDKAKRGFQDYVKKLQSAAEAEIKRLQAKVQAQAPAKVEAKINWMKYLPIGIGAVSYTHLTLPTICSV